MSREKDYKSTTYEGTRQDGSKYIIAQVGDNEINGEKYYRYYYADTSQDGKISNQTVVYSKTNVAHFIDERNFGGKIPDGYEKAINRILFSKENIRDSLSKGTLYIGKVRKGKNDNKIELVSDVSEITKSEDEQKLFQYPTKEYTRDDGSSFVVQQMSRGQDANGTKVNCYHIFEVIIENGRQVVKRNVVYSEQDLLKDNRKGIANDFLSRDRLDRKVGEAGGYIGYYDQNGIRTYSGNLVEYFKSNESVKVKKKTQTNMQSKNTPNSKKITPEQIQRKRQWIKDFIKDYEDSEQNTAYALRENCEEKNIKTVLQSIKTGKFSGIYDNYAQDYGYELSRVMLSIARLLKEADNLTIDGGEDYLAQFADIPQINKILLQIKASDEYKQMHSEAETNRKNNTLPKFKKTIAQVDKEYAQAYLRSNNLSKQTIQEEIDYRKGLLYKDKIKISDEKDIKNLSITRKQQISLTRVLARQEGKIPSGAKWDEKIGWYCDTDINQKQQDLATEKIVASDKIDEGYITPSRIVDSTVRIGMGKQEINEVIKEIKGTHNKDLQQSYEK